MYNKSHIPITADYFLKPGYIIIPQEPTIISTVLGSEVAICMYDRKCKFGGMNHFQFPVFDGKSHPTARHGDAATVTLVRLMIQFGSKIHHLEAQIFGGAHNPEIGDQNIGEENYIVARKVLARKGVRIVSEDVGGEKGRKIVFNTQTNEIAVLKVTNLRNKDWYPYNGDR